MFGQDLIVFFFRWHFPKVFFKPAASSKNNAISPWRQESEH